ncbi:restriction endonuclease subunit S [Staphylococcus hominis]|jgi:type I restriction enzyme S subunit|uniref:restriction endonuclease subunit S n=1 Tax=Staphylococcus hominis TaxID=1290 RepID=UPI00069F4618|nr:restriction endonuclease subunit S [Staphylococcus hominis]MCI2877072.1 restriction endonuclease subunit S [Staphylococcus hominis]TRL33642.1 restriction endonuclease subunit S [Staphylococcus hominis]
MTEQTNTPELRFPEFSYVWKSALLGDVSYITKLAGFEFTKYVNYSNKGKVPAIRGLNVKNGRFNFKELKYIDDSDFSKLSRSKLLPKDIVFTYVGTIGNAAIVPNNTNWYLAPNVAKIRSTNVDPKFLLQILINPNFKRREIFSWITTSSQPALSMSNIRNFKLYLPSIMEQEKLGEFFSKLDRQIELEEEKLELLKQQKKGYMQKVFSQELRFKDENGNDYPDWKLKKLSNIADIIGGGTPSTKKSEYWDGDINWFSPAEIGDKEFVSTSQRRITEKGLEKSSAKMLPIGTVLFTSRAGIGKTAILSKEATTNQGFQSIVPKENDLDSYFLYSMTSILKRNAEKVGAGSTFSEVSRKQMEQIKLLIPILKEQKQIGRLFQIINRKINKQIHKIELLKQRKKGLLQKMFV